MISLQAYPVLKKKYGNTLNSNPQVAQELLMNGLNRSLKSSKVCARRSIK
jgi:hypothetical protein